jgi:hypothetical protein
MLTLIFFTVVMCTDTVIFTMILHFFCSLFYSFMKIILTVFLWFHFYIINILFFIYFVCSKLNSYRCCVSQLAVLLVMATCAVQPVA